MDLSNMILVNIYKNKGVILDKLNKHKVYAKY